MALLEIFLVLALIGIFCPDFETGLIKHYLSGREANGCNKPKPNGEGGENDWDYCTGKGCGRGQGDCDGDSECAGDLVCGLDNCADFHYNTEPKADCCRGKYILC